METENKYIENQSTGKYINPFTDFGFKKIFGEEPNKDLLIDFLNALLVQHNVEIKTLTYKKTDHLGTTDLDRKVVFDLYCTNEKGEKFIVEMQKSKQKFFKDRALYYSTFPIQEQAKRGKEWNYELKAVFAIAVLDFSFDENPQDSQGLNLVKLVDTHTCEVFYDKLTYIFIQMTNFTKTIDELESHLDKWLYVLKNLESFDRIPEKIRDKIFQKVFKISEYQKLSKDERAAYEDSLKYYRDLKNTIDTAQQDGYNKATQEYQSIIENALQQKEEERRQKEEERRQKEEERQQKEEAQKRDREKSVKLALRMLKNNEPIAEICKETGLTEEEVKELKINK